MEIESIKMIVRIRRWLAVGLLFVVNPACFAQATETVTYYYTNEQGTPLATADASGNILTTSDYRPYGSQVLGSPAGGPGYTGHVNDTDSGLVYMQARYYDPVVGRFLSVDPTESEVGATFSVSRYLYADGNPVGNVDPNGKDSRVSMYAYSLNIPFNSSIAHSFVRIDDLDRNQSFVARGGPSEPVGSSSGVSNLEQAQGDSGLLNMSPPAVYLAAAPPQLAQTSHDATNPGAYEVSATSVVVPGDTNTLLNTVRGLNTNLNSAKIPYKAQTQNSNSYAATLYNLITGKKAPVSNSLPGGEKSLKDVMTSCDATAGCKP